MDGASAALGTIIVSIGGTLLVFLVARELVCWYWKINEGLKLLQSIDTALRWQNARLAAHDQHAAQQHAASWAPPPSP